MEALVFIIVSSSILGYGLVSGKLERSAVTAPMAYVLFGLAASREGLDLVEVTVEHGSIHALAEITLVLVLFGDAARIDLRLLFREHDLPVRLLGFGMPMTILLGAALSVVLFPGLGFFQAAVLAAILAPTDAALGQAVVNCEEVPVRIRQTLNVESGLNDGIVLPVLLVLLSLAGAADTSEPAAYWVRFAVQQISVGIVVGLLAGYAGGKLVERASDAGWMSHPFRGLSALGLSLLAYSAAVLLQGNGFIAAFCSGLAVGNFSRSICTCVYDFAEAEGQLLTMLVFMIFGGAMLPEILEHLRERPWGETLRVGAYAVLSLTVVRMVPVSLGLRGMRLRRSTVLFLGWFGPRGLASILFALLVLERTLLPGRELVLSVVVVTVLLSVFAHGATAFPLSRWYGRRLARGAPEPEHLPVGQMPVRVPYSRRQARPSPPGG